MIELAHEEYGYKEDGRLNDTLSEITNINLCIGEISGPIIGSFLPVLIGYRYTTSALAMAFFIYCTFYSYSNQVLSKKMMKKNPATELLIEMK